MTVALWGLVGLSLLVLIHVSVDSFLLKGSVGNVWTVGARDHPPEIGALAARAHRALWNLLETAPAFLALALVAHLTGRRELAGVYGGHRPLADWRAGRVRGQG